MNTNEIVNRVKRVIMEELFSNSNNGQCEIELYIEGHKDIQILSKVSQLFLEQQRIELLKEYRNENNLNVRKYEYEKILNKYLERKYDVDKLENDYNIDNIVQISLNNCWLDQNGLRLKKEYESKLEEKHKKELEERQKKELEERQKIELEERRKKEAEEKQKRLEVEKILNSIMFLKWEKCIRNGIVYTAKCDNGKDIKILYKKNGKKNKIVNKIVYSNYTLQYDQDRIDEIVSVIEKTKPKRVRADNIIVVVKEEYLRNKYSAQNAVNKKEKENRNRNNKNNLEISNKNIQNQILNDRNLVVENLGEKYNLKKEQIEKLAQQYQEKCRNRDEYTEKICLEKNKSCDVLAKYCAYNKNFMFILNKELQYKNPKYEQIDDIAKQFNVQKKDVIDIENVCKDECGYYRDGECSCERVRFRQCHVEDPRCLYHGLFIVSLMQRKAAKQNKIDSVANQNRTNNVTIKPQINRKEEKKDIVQIGVKDFVVKGNTFKCMHSKHKIENIDASIAIDKEGKKYFVDVSAGHCSQCNVYFIMDSTFQKLKKQGIILCRISDEKSYYKGGVVNGMHLAQESILMQYGYNVSQTEGLSELKRQKILAVIIDNNVLSKSEIISYLDFFINQRKSSSKMGIAISKWEADREFVENYKIGHYTQFGVKAIYRK